MKQLLKKILLLDRERDLIAKGICVLLAVLLWAVISSSKIEKLEVRIPVTIENLPQNLMVSDIKNKFVIVKIEGEKGLIKSVNEKNIKATVNLDNPAIGVSKKYPINLSKSLMPEDIELKLLQKQVTITIEKREEKWVRVEASITGKIEEGKKIVNLTVVPERIKISGPQSVIQEINLVYTDDISVNNSYGELKRQVGLKRGKLKNVTFSTRIVLVKMLILETKNLITFHIPIVIRNINREFNYILNNNKVKIIVRSKENIKVVKDDFEAIIDAGKIDLKKLFSQSEKKEEQIEVPLRVNAKNIDNIDIISIIPKVAQIKIVRK